MNNKNIKIAALTAIIFSFSLAGCANNGNGTANVPRNRNTAQNNTVRNGRLRTNLTPDGTLKDNGANIYDDGFSNMRGINDKEFSNNRMGNNAITREGMQESTTQDDSNNTYDATRENAIENAVNKIAGVKSSKVIIAGNRAIVGVDIQSNKEGKLTTELKKKVESTVKNTDKKIQTVAVSADPDLFKRITDVGEGIRGGKPLARFANEIEEIFRRIIPQ